MPKYWLKINPKTASCFVSPRRLGTRQILPESDRDSNPRQRPFGTFRWSNSLAKSMRNFHRWPDSIESFFTSFYFTKRTWCFVSDWLGSNFLILGSDWQTGGELETIVCVIFAISHKWLLIAIDIVKIFYGNNILNGPFWNFSPFKLSLQLLYFGQHLGTFWATFYFNVWSHCPALTFLSRMIRSRYPDTNRLNGCRMKATDG